MPRRKRSISPEKMAALIKQEEKENAWLGRLKIGDDVIVEFKGYRGIAAVKEVANGHISLLNPLHRLYISSIHLPHRNEHGNSLIWAFNVTDGVAVDVWHMRLEKVTSKSKAEVMRVNRNRNLLNEIKEEMGEIRNIYRVHIWVLPTHEQLKKLNSGALEVFLSACQKFLKTVEKIPEAK